MTDLFAVVAVGFGTYFSRSVFILALANRVIPAPVLVALEFVAPAVLGALIVTLLIDGEGRLAAGLPELGAFLVAGWVAYKTRSHVWTLIVGMTIFWVVRALV